MNKKHNLVLLFGLLLTACNLNIGGNNNSTNKISSSSLGENISSNSSTNGEESSSKIEYVDNVKMIDIEEYQDTHTYNNPNFKDFPNYSESQWNKNLKFTLSSDGTYYSVSDGTGADRKLNSDTLIIPAYYNGLPVEEIKQAREGVGAFSELSWLKTVYLPHTIKRIEYGTFSLSSIEKLYIDCAELENFDGRNWVFYPSISTSYKGMDVYFGPNVKRIPSRLFYPNVAEPQFVPKINNIYFDKDCKVTSIGAHAFHNVDRYTSLSLPDTVESIEEFAFYNSSFTELVLPSSLKMIANDAFEFSSLEHIKVNNKLETIGERAFAYTALEGIDLFDTFVNIIEDEAFAYISKLEGVKFPSSLTEIGERAFYQSGLKNLIITDNVTIIRRDAFANNRLLENLYLGKGLKILLERAFYNVDKLTNLNIASIELNDLAYGNQVFTNAGKINGMQVYITDGVKVIPSNMFFSTADIDLIANINTLSIPNTLERIGECAFSDIEINRINYRGTIKEFEKLLIEEDGITYNKIEFGGNNNA